MPQIRRLARWLYFWAAFVAVLLVLAIGFPGTSALAMLLRVLLPPRLRAPAGRRLIQAGFRLIVALLRTTGLYRLDFTELEALRTAGGLVITPNHPCLLDVVLIVAHVPNVVCITKAGLWNNPLTGGTARLAAYIRNDAPLKLVRRAVGELHAGANLLVFPEGTRTPADAGVLGPFKPGFALMAKAAGAPVQPVFIETDTPYLRKGWPVWRKPSLPMSCRIRLGERTLVEGPVPEFTDALEVRMRAELRQ